MIKSFLDDDTGNLYRREPARRFPPAIWKMAHKKLLLIDLSLDLDQLRFPPGNRLEALQGVRKGQHSIRVNDRYRICFEWKDGDAYQVELVDDH